MCHPRPDGVVHRNDLALKLERDNFLGENALSMRLAQVSLHASVPLADVLHWPEYER